MNLNKLERYWRVNLLGPGSRLMKKEFSGPRSHKCWQTLSYILPRPLGITSRWIVKHQQHVASWLSSGRKGETVDNRPQGWVRHAELWLFTSSLSLLRTQHVWWLSTASPDDGNRSCSETFFSFWNTRCRESVTRKGKTRKLNIEACSRNNCCRETAMIITYSEYVSVAYI
jgi:hypothetical protein